MNFDKNLKKKLFKDGYLFLPNFFNEDEINLLIKTQNLNHYKQKSNNSLNEIDFNNIVKPLGNFEDYWKVISNKKILKTLKNLLDNDIVYLHNSHSVIQKTDSDIDINWHRDNPCRTYGLGSDWDKNIFYNVIRVGIYIPENDHSTGLGVIPKSHKSKNYICKLLSYTRINFKRIYFSKYFRLFFNNLFSKNVYVKKGDCIIFLANLYHRSLKTVGTRRAIFLSYGTNNKHAKHYLDYYLNQRDDRSSFTLDPAKVDIEKFKKFLIDEKIYIDLPR